MAAIGSGAVMPFFSFIFGDVTLIYINPDPIQKALDVAIKFWLLGLAGMLLSTTIFLFQASLPSTAGQWPASVNPSATERCTTNYYCGSKYTGTTSPTPTNSPPASPPKSPPSKAPSATK